MKIVREHIIFEKFSEDSDPIHDLGIGMEYQLKKFALKNNYSLNFDSKENLNILMCNAANYGELEILKYLIKQKNADILYFNGYALRHAVASGNYNVVKYILSLNKFDVNSDVYENAIEWAMSFKHPNILKLLEQNKKLKSNKKLKESLNEKFTEDSDPITDMNIGMIHQIKKWMESKHYQYVDKDYALIICAEYGKTEFVKYLLDAGADVHASGDYALRNASYHGHIEVVKLLLDAGADVHASGDEALRWASYNGSTEIVKLLLVAGADVHADNDEALRWASRCGNKEVVKLLKDHIAKEKKLKNKIKESLNEKFSEESDPVHDLGIGINTLIKNWFLKLGLDEDLFKRYVIINDDYKITLKIGLYLSQNHMGDLPEFIQFKDIKGDFDISKSNLTTLRGCPEIVQGNFFCNDNNLTSLEYSPKEVSGRYDCRNNKKFFSRQEIHFYCPKIGGYINNE